MSHEFHGSFHLQWPNNTIVKIVLLLQVEGDFSVDPFGRTFTARPLNQLGLLLHHFHIERTYDLALWIAKLEGDGFPNPRRATGLFRPQTSQSVNRRKRPKIRIITSTPPAYDFLQSLHFIDTPHTTNACHLLDPRISSSRPCRSDTTQRSISLPSFTR